MREIEESEPLIDALVERLEAGVTQKLKRKISRNNAELGEQ